MMANLNSISTQQLIDELRHRCDENNLIDLDMVKLDDDDFVVAHYSNYTWECRGPALLIAYHPDGVKVRGKGYGLWEGH